MTTRDISSSKPRICYAGLNPCGIHSLVGHADFDLVATALIRSLLRFSWNPSDWLFQLVYALRRGNKCPMAEGALASLLYVIQPTLSQYNRRFLPYLRCLCQNRISVVDLTSSPAGLSQLRSVNCELLIINVWDIIPKEVLACFCKGAINIHPSALPRYRGALPTLWSIRNEDTASAVSFITLAQAVDAGKILLQVPFAISPLHTWRDIEEAVDAIVEKHIAVVLRSYLSGETTGTEQSDESQSGTALYSSYQRIDLATESVREIENKVPYYPHWEPDTYCYANCDRIRVHIRKLVHVADAPVRSQETSERYKIKGLCLCLQCRDGTLQARLFRDIPFRDSILLALRHCSILDGLLRFRRSALALRLGELTLGHAVNQLTIYLFEFALYPLVIFWLGLLKGFAVMSSMSFAISLLSIWFYDWSKRDWLGIEAIKSLKGYAGSNRLGLALAWLLRQSDPVACVLLSLRYDPFIVTVYLRRGRFGGMTRRDWRIFLLSWLIGNAWWSVVCFTGLSAVQWLWAWVKAI